MGQSHTGCWNVRDVPVVSSFCVFSRPVSPGSARLGGLLRVDVGPTHRLWVSGQPWLPPLQDFPSRLPAPPSQPRMLTWDRLTWGSARRGSCRVLRHTQGPWTEGSPQEEAASGGASPPQPPWVKG